MRRWEPTPAVPGWCQGASGPAAGAHRGEVTALRVRRTRGPGRGSPSSPTGAGKPPASEGPLGPGVRAYETGEPWAPLTVPRLLRALHPLSAGLIRVRGKPSGNRGENPAGGEKARAALRGASFLGRGNSGFKGPKAGASSPYSGKSGETRVLGAQ